MAERVLNVWEGVYESFADAGASGAGFTSSTWVERSAEHARATVAWWREGGSVPSTSAAHEYVLPVLVALTLEKGRTSRLLDFGGSVGFSVPGVLGSLPDDASLEFHIVDNAEVCRVGEQVFAGEPRVVFRRSLPDARERFDLVHCGSSLQYVEDWEGLLGGFRAYQPRYLLLSDLQAGDIPTFVTVQNYYGDRIPQWFWNLDEFVGTLAGMGYRLLYKTHFVKTVLGRTGPLPMQNLPEPYRLTHGCHLLFAA